MMGTLRVSRAASTEDRKELRLVAHLGEGDDGGRDEERFHGFACFESNRGIVHDGRFRQTPGGGSGVPPLATARVDNGRCLKLAAKTPGRTMTGRFD